MNNDLISIIVPVYKVEKYLSTCLDSIISQTYKNIEILLIDDGSPDECGMICDAYANTDSRIHVIHQENGGLSVARNTGIEKAKGEYLSFIDSDDFVSSFFIEILHKAIEDTGADIASTEYDINKFTDGNEKSIRFPKTADDYTVRNISIDEALELMLYQQIPNGAQYRLYNKKIFDELRFPKGWIFEDVATVYKAFMKSNSIALVKSAIYAYRIREDGIVKSKFSQSKMVVVPITDNMYRDIVSYSKSLSSAAASRAFSQNYHVFLQIPISDKKDIEPIWLRMKKYRWTVLNDRNILIRKKNKLGALTTYFGMYAAHFLGKLYLAIR